MSFKYDTWKSVLWAVPEMYIYAFLPSLYINRLLNCLPAKSPFQDQSYMPKYSSGAHNNSFVGIQATGNCGFRDHLPLTRGVDVKKRTVMMHSYIACYWG